MALQGNLKDLRLGDVLQTVLTSGLQGVLRVRSGARRARIQVAKDGLHLIEPEVLDEKMILDGFVARGVVSPNVAAHLRAQDAGSILDSLVNGSGVSPSDLRAVLFEAAEDHVLEVLAWSEGDFRFDEAKDGKNDTPPGPVASVAMEPGGLFLRAAQRVDDRARITQRLGTDPRLVIPVPGAVPPADLDPVAAKVFGRLDGVRCLDEIALKEGLGLFAAQLAAFTLIEAGLARAPATEELLALSKQREEAGDVRTALALLRQWQGVSPTDPEPFAAAAALCARAKRSEDALQALKAQGRVLLAAQKPQPAREIFTRILSKVPSDSDALEGLRQAAKALRDKDTFSEATRRLAKQAMDDGDAPQACSLLQELVESSPDDLDARVLHSKALVRVADRAKALEDIERIADLLPTPCRRRSDREAAAWCLGALLQLAPERSDLLRRFRAMGASPKGGRARILIVVGLVLACSGIGFVLWPRPAAGLLERARAAADRGETVTALSLIAELAQRYPDSQESEAAQALKHRIDPNAGGKGKKFDPKLLESVKAKEAAAISSLHDWPDPKAIADANALATALKTPEGMSLRDPVTDRLRGPFGEAVSALRREAMSRRDALDAAAVAAAKPPSDLVAFLAIVDGAKAALDGTWIESAGRASEAARRLAGSLNDASFPPMMLADLHALDADVSAAARAAQSRPADVDRAAREYHKALIADAYERARVEAVGVLVRGDLAGAEAYYGKLDSLLQEIEADPALKPLRDLVDRRGIREFSLEKKEMMGTIHRGIAAAKAAEEAGNLAGAAAAYAALVRQFPLVRFDEVFTIPVRVESVPPGALVSLNGRDLGRTPLVVRYGWGSQAALTLAAEGYETGSAVLRTADPTPSPDVRVSLVPLSRWTQPLVGIVDAPPLGLDGDVVLCNRSGRVERRSKETGDVRWTIDVKGVEGVRGRPALEGGVLWIPLLDGRAARVSADNGAIRAPLTLPGRPVGDAAALPGRIAFALDDALAVFAGREEATRVPVPATVTAGVLAAHGAFWVGDARGGLTRVDAASLAPATLALGSKDPVVGLAAGARTILVLTADGALSAVDPSGKSILWRRDGLGDAAGAPAEAAGLAVAADRAGHVRLFSASDGSPRGERMAGAEPRGGLLVVAGRIVASLADGRLWVLDTSTGTVVMDSPLKGTSRFPAADLGDGTVAVPAQGNGVTVISVVK